MQHDLKSKCFINIYPRSHCLVLDDLGLEGYEKRTVSNQGLVGVGSTLEGSLELGSLLGILHDEGDKVTGGAALELDAVLVLLDLDN